MHNSLPPKQGPASVYPNPCVVIDPFHDGIGTKDYLTGRTVRCALAYVDGEKAVAMFIRGRGEPLIFSEDFLIDLFNRGMAQLEVRRNAGLSLIGSNPATLDPISGTRVEAGLVFIEDEVLFAISVGTDQEPFLVIPEFFGGMLELVWN